MWLAVAKVLVNWLAISAVLSRLCSLVNRQVCWQNMESGWGLHGAWGSWGQLSVFGTIVSGTGAGMCVDCCVLLLIGFGLFWE